MQPFKLVREGTEKAIAQACGECGRVYPLDDTYAIRCCDPRCADCNAALPPKWSWTVCDPCREKRDAVREAERRAKAIRVPLAEYHEAMVYVEGGWNDGFMSPDELDDWADSEGVECPAEVWACESRALHAPSAEQIVEQFTEDAYDGAYDDIVAVDELDAAIRAFNAQQTARVYHVDHSLIVVMQAQPATPVASRVDSVPAVD